MKIVIATGIYPPDAGGPATYTRAMARAFSNAGHAVEVVCYTDEEHGARGTGHGEDSFIVQRIKRSPLLIRYVAFLRSVYAAAKRADLVYLQGPVSEGFPGTLGALLARKPTVMKIVGDYAWEMYMQEPGDDKKVLLDEFVGAAPVRKSIKIRLIEVIERWTAKRAKKIIVPSAYLKKIVSAWGVPEDRIVVIANAIEPLTVSMDRETARTELRVEDKRVLFTLVRCVPWKHVDFIMNVLRDLPPDVQFVVGGDGPELPKLREAARALGVESRVTFTGRLARSKASDWYLAADAFVLPSGYEGFPHVIPEAASVGLHSFVSDRGGNPETQTLLGADCVTVLPYLDRSAWLEALSKAWPIRIMGTIPAALSFPIMANRTMDVLKSSVIL